MPVWLLAAEVLATILGLFVFGSFRYQIHKNALTYGMLLVIIATFCGLPTSTWHVEIAERGLVVLDRSSTCCRFAGLDDLIHADTMLFILGLTLFVSVIAQTRVLEGITFFLLRRNQGVILPTIISVTAVVAVASGVLGGVSMIGLTIRTLVIILMLGRGAGGGGALRRHGVHGRHDDLRRLDGLRRAAEPDHEGEPVPEPGQRLLPAIRRAGRHRQLSRRRLAASREGSAGQRVDLENMDVIDANAEDVRFLQATRHGEVMTPVELIEGHAPGPRRPGRSRHGAAAQRRVARPRDDPRRRAEVGRRRCCSAHFVSEELADGLDRHYLYDAAGRYEEALGAELAVDEVLAAMGQVRRRAQKIGALRARAVHGHAHRARRERRGAAVSGLVCRVRRRAAGHRRASRRCAAWRCARRRRSTPSTTFCFRCSCRSRC